MSDLQYPITIRPLTEQEGKGYFVEFPDLPGCVADGDTIEEALAEAEDAVEAWVQTASEFGDEIPKPSTANKYSGQWRLRLPKSLHAELALRAHAEGVSLNTLAVVMLERALRQKPCGHSVKEKPTNENHLASRK